MACSRLQSFLTYAGSLPPSSRPAFINLSPIAFLTCLPPLTDPVKRIWSILSSEIMFEVDWWSKCKNWKTPSGIPADFEAWNNCSAHRGVCEECFRITVLPDKRDGTIELTDVL